MSFLVQLRKLVLGETWIVPIGVAIAVGGGAAVRELVPGVWDAAGGALLVVAAGAVLLVAVGRGAAAKG
jgi:hypothetical protein